MKRVVLLCAVVGAMFGCDNGTGTGACTVLDCDGGLTQAGAQTRQVLIEVRIVEVTQDFTETLGVDFDLDTPVQEDNGGILGGVSAHASDILALSDATGGAADRLHLIPGNHHADSYFGVVWRNFLREFTDTAEFVAAPPFPCFEVDGNCVVALAGFPGIDLQNLSPRDPGLTGATVHSALLDDIQLDAVLQAIEAVGTHQILSVPHLTLYDGQRSAITVQDFTPEVTRLTTPFYDAVTGIVQAPFGVFAGPTLEVTPQITNDTWVNLEVRLGSLGVSAYLSQQFDADGQPSDLEFPILQTSRAHTNIEVPDGETVVIGGLTRMGQTESEPGVPWLKDLPLIGLLFGDGSRFDDPDAELLVFLTPRILPEE